MHGACLQPAYWVDYLRDENLVLQQMQQFRVVVGHPIHQRVCVCACVCKCARAQAWHMWITRARAPLYVWWTDEDGHETETKCVTWLSAQKKNAQEQHTGDRDTDLAELQLSH